MKNILLLITSDRFAYPLIDYIQSEAKIYGWKLTVGSLYDPVLLEDLQRETADVPLLHIKDEKQCEKEIRRSDLVMAILSDVMLLTVADMCIRHSRRLISPARLTRQLYSKKSQAEENDALILVECGFTPGLDHLTAKKMIDHIHAKGGHIATFKTYSGSLLAGSDADNPWAFKLTHPANELFSVARGNNRYLINGYPLHVPADQVFARAEDVDIPGMSNVVVIPDEDSLYCQRMYGLQEAGTVMKGRVLTKGFQSIWALLVRLGLTNTTTRIDMLDHRSFRAFLRSLLPWSPSESLEDLLKRTSAATDTHIEQLRWLGLLDDTWLDGTQDITPAMLLQYLIEHKLAMEPDDRDCIVIHHEMEYTLNGSHYNFRATLLNEGEDEQHSALARAIGLTMGAAAKAVMIGNIKIRGMHTPIRKEIYDPVLNELEDLGIAFHVEETKTTATEVSTV